METFIIDGVGEFTCQKLNAMAGAKMLNRLQKIVLPILASLTDAKPANNKLLDKHLLEMDVKFVAQVFSAHLTDEMLEDVVMRLFKECRVYHVEKKRYLDSMGSMDVVFSVDTIFGLYELFFMVAKYQFTPFLESLAGRFGNLLDVPTKPIFQEN